MVSPAPSRCDRILLDVVRRVTGAVPATRCDPMRAELSLTDARVTLVPPAGAGGATAGEPHTSQ